MSWNPNQGQDPNQPAQPEGYPQQPGINQGVNHNKAPIKADTNSRAINQVGTSNPAISQADTNNSQVINQAVISNQHITSKRNMALPILPPIRMVLLRWAWMPMLQRD